MNDTFSNDGLWIFALLLLLFAGGGFGGLGNAANNALTQQDALMNSNFENLARTTQSISDRQYEQANNLTKGIADLGYTLAQQSNQIGSAIVSEGRNISNQIADTKAAVHAEGEATRSMIQQNKIAELEAQVNELKTQNMFCGVPKINPYAYGVYNTAPYSCGCNNI